MYRCMAAAIDSGEAESIGGFVVPVSYPGNSVVLPISQKWLLRDEPMSFIISGVVVDR